MHVDDNRRKIRMYFHGMREDGEQRTRAAVSTDGISFEARPEILGNTAAAASRESESRR